MKAGEQNGIRGYFLTFMIAYIREFAAQYRFAAESFETSVPWNKVASLCSSVKERLMTACKKVGLPENKVFVSSRVTQLYETGATIYVYFGFNYDTIPNDKMVEVYEAIEDDARDEIMKAGGSISHHHGVGKIRKRFMKRTMTEPGLTLM